MTAESPTVNVRGLISMVWIKGVHVTCKLINTYNVYKGEIDGVMGCSGHV